MKVYDVIAGVRPNIGNNPIPIMKLNWVYYNMTQIVNRNVRVAILTSQQLRTEDFN